MLKENSTYKPKGYWRDLENRKRFFTELAEENGFDPLDAKKWRKVSRTVIAQKKVESFFSLKVNSSVTTKRLECYIVVYV